MIMTHTDQNTKSCIIFHDHTHQADSNHVGIEVMDMERATQDGYLTHRTLHEKFMHQPS